MKKKRVVRVEERKARVRGQAREIPKKPKREIGLTLNWNRAIHINKPIDDVLLKELTPIILKMKQENSEPITVGIDSPGGSISTMESLLSLLKSPDQDGKIVKIYTVATNRAYSAAASFLAFGDYSISFPHSNILYHDVRYSDIDDVTSDKALEAARRLERSNAAFSLKLADKIKERLIWVYLDLKPTFGKVRERWKEFAGRYDNVFSELLPKDQKQIVDVVGLSLALFSKLSRPNDRQVALQALKLLASWMQVERIEQGLSNVKSGKAKDPARGINELIKMIGKMDLGQVNTMQIPKSIKGSSLSGIPLNDIRLLLEVLARRLVIDKEQCISNNWLDKVIEDFSFIKDIRDPKHIKMITRMMAEHTRIFFDKETADKIRSAKNEEEKNKFLAPFYPQARFFWYYIVLICRCLCRGNNLLTPCDAQLLGLVDEILGGGLIQSKREWRKMQPDYK